jgi:RNA polymerase sigma-70 factor (ECF subfamily)
MLSFLLPRHVAFVPSDASAADQDTAAWLARLTRGDHAALEPLYRREAGAVYRYALALSGNPAWAADAVQDAFLALAQRPAAVDPALGTLGAWLAGVARHSLSARWRQLRRESPLDAETGDDDGTNAWPADEAAFPDDDGAALPGPAERLVRAQTAEQVWDALRRLPLPFAEAVVLVDLQERPYAEAAAIAGVPVNTLRTRLHRGRLRLAEALGAPHPTRGASP